MKESERSNLEPMLRSKEFLLGFHRRKPVHKLIDICGASYVTCPTQIGRDGAPSRDNVTPRAIHYARTHILPPRAY